MTTDEFFDAAKELSFEDRVELAHCHGTNSWTGFRRQSSSNARGAFFAWKTLDCEGGRSSNASNGLNWHRPLWKQIADEGYVTPLCLQDKWMNWIGEPRMP